MFKLLISLLINLIASIIQLIMTPFNLVIVNTMPNISDKILQVTNGIPQIINYMNYALGFVPPGIITVMLFILTCEIAKHTIFTSTHVLVKVWNILQKIKFW